MKYAMIAVLLISGAALADEEPDPKESVELPKALLIYTYDEDRGEGVEWIVHTGSDADYETKPRRRTRLMPAMKDRTAYRSASLGRPGF